MHKQKLLNEYCLKIEMFTPFKYMKLNFSCTCASHLICLLFIYIYIYIDICFVFISLL